MSAGDPGDYLTRREDVLLAERDKTLVFVLGCNQHLDKVGRDLQVYML